MVEAEHTSTTLNYEIVVLLYIVPIAFLFNLVPVILKPIKLLKPDMLPTKDLLFERNIAVMPL
ncbi:hypothetical protein [Pontibacter cellulosilyticus]|uniref:Uncharacterized protein n=1 Tax=Pontibacter cellulosilyticus TaxID=1720253 RepID=A0A923SLU9_9BACT|nr:hypothetical protein [Pontibacter cellulosilyticus]MBC5991525.1 hypothetical protein [Pontibacter cellulosilyticus]